MGVCASRKSVFGGEMSDTSEFGSLAEANEILGLMADQC
jgi:hypothetical protein